MASSLVSLVGIREALASTILSLTRIIQVTLQRSREYRVLWVLRELSHVLGVVMSLEGSLQGPVPQRQLTRISLLHAENGIIQQFQRLLSELERLTGELDDPMSSDEVANDVIIQSVTSVGRFRSLFRQALEGTLDESDCAEVAQGTGPIPLRSSRSVCELCSNLGSVRRSRGSNWASLESLAASSSTGCEGCTVLDTIMHPYKATQKGLLVRMGDSTIGLVMQLQLDGFDLEVCMTPGTRGPNKERACPWNGSAIRYPISGDTGSAVAVTQVHRWLQTCL
jgi:hypothetical protein